MLSVRHFKLYVCDIFWVKLFCYGESCQDSTCDPGALSVPWA